MTALTDLDQQARPIIALWKTQGEQGMKAAEALESMVNMVRTYSQHQPDPQPGRDVVALEVVRDFNARVASGKRNYGTFLMTHNGRSFAQDLLDELWDGVFYLTGLRLEHPELFARNLPEPE
jgi:hypothetical protein